MNKIQVIGRFTADPEVRKTQDGVSVCTFTLAVDRNFVKKGEERQADFIDFVAWRNQAEFLEKHFGKGDAIGISGTLHTRHYEDKETGKSRKVTEVIVEEITFAGRTKKDLANAATK